MRRSGKTTRIIDRCIQELFNKGKTYVYSETRNTKDSKDAFDIFKKRLDIEHPNTKYVIKTGYVDDIFCYTVELHDL